MGVHWLQPYRTDKNIGKAINEAIVQTCNHFLQDDDWVVLMDHDILFLLPDTKAHIIDILSKTSYDILGCMTNRLGEDTQRVAGMFDEDSISAHVECAGSLWATHGASVRPAEVVAAMLMCFKVSTWRTLGGFKENNLGFDYLFCMRAPRAGLRIGVMSGVYIMHLYRYGSADPRNDIKHLEI